MENNTGLNRSRIDPLSTMIGSELGEIWSIVPGVMPEPVDRTGVKWADTDLFRVKVAWVLLFLRERCELGEEHTVMTSELYESYGEWAAGEEGAPELTKPELSAALRKLGYEKDRPPGTRRTRFHGLRLKS